MVSPNKIDDILLNLAITIGSNIGCNLLDTTIPVICHSLNCKSVVIIQCNQEVNKVIFTTGAVSNSIIEQSALIYPKLSSTNSFQEVILDKNSYYFFHLPNYGLLILQFETFPIYELNKLTSIFSLLANACIVSEQLINLSAEKQSNCKERSLLHAVIENIPDPLYVKDTEGRKILLNKAEAQLLGKNDVSEIIGKTDTDFYPPEIAQKTIDEDKMIIETGQSVIHRDGLLTTLNGNEIWIQGTKIPHYDESGKISGIIGISHNITAFKKIENELREVANKYQSIFNSFLDLYYRSDLKGTILELSPSVFHLSGYKPEELVGKTVAEVYADIESRNRMVQLLIEKGTINDYENLLIHKDGHLVPVSITSHLIKDSNGKPGYIEGTIRDISERKEAEAKLNKLMKLQNLLTHLATEFINIPVENSDEAVDKLLSAVGEGNDIDRVYIFEYDFVKNTMSNTHEWCADGISPEIDNLQQIPNEFLPEWVETHKKGESLIVEDVSQLDKEGVLFKVLDPQGIKTLITIPLLLNNECLGFVGFDSVRVVKSWSAEEITFLQVLADLLCNVTDRKRTDEVLRNQQASLNAIFNNVPFQMWLKDVDSKYLAVNKPFMDYFSITDESQVIGKTAIDIWNNEAGQHFIDQDRIVMRDLKLQSVEELIDFKHKTVWFEIFRAPIVDANGQLLGTTGIARDISKRKETDRTLQEAVKAAEAANEAKSKFLAIMSHEIRNPLNAVVGMVRLLHNAGIKEPNNKNLIENIKTSSDHLLMIINDILDFSKIESGEMILEVTNFNLKELVGRVGNSHFYIAKEKQLELTSSIDSRLGQLFKGDPLRLQQVLSNLVSNAIKFTSKGSVKILCELESADDIKANIRFSVEDTGIGIKAENQCKVFESFKQADDTISRTHGGSGLGLAISKQIVELMGGSLKLESKENIGSKFYFSISLPILHETSKDRKNSDKKIQLDSLKGYKVLLVEDNKLNQILATTMLEKWETNIVVAGNGQQAVEILENEKFDIILMDIQMPIMDGMTASRIIRDKLKLDTPILALTANVVKGIVEKCEEAGMQGYVSKPFETDDLFHKILTQISTHKSSIINEEEPTIQIADISRLTKMIGSDSDQVNKMIQKFIEITPTYVNDLNNGEATNNIEIIASASHKIKSSIDLVSTEVMRELILRINHESRTGGCLEQIKPLVKQFNTYYQILENQLQEEIITNKN